MESNLDEVVFHTVTIVHKRSVNKKLKSDSVTLMNMVVYQSKINYHAQNVKIWRRNVECHNLTFSVQRVMLLRAVRRHKHAFV